MPIHPLPILAATGFFAGLNTACWGAYKDSPYESFSLTSFLRSIAIGTSLGVLLYLVSPDARAPGQWVPAFFVIVGLERICTEYRKSFFLDRSQANFRIPQAFAVFGEVLASRRLRAAVGIGMIGFVVAVDVGFDRVFASLPLPAWARYGIVASLSGLLIAIGGAWKDAPIEGFGVRVFARSIAVCVAIAATLFIALGVHPAGHLFLTVLGAERFCCEFYKTFVSQRAPGKFIGGVEHPAWLERRRWLVPLYATSVVYLAGLLQIR